MTHRYQPPPAPELPAVPRLQVQRATRSVRERARWYGAFAGLVMATAAWAGVFAFGVDVPVPVFVCGAVPGALVLVAGVMYFGLPLVDEATRWWLSWQSARQEVALRDVTTRAGVESRAHWDHRYSGAPRPEPPPIIQREPPPVEARARVAPAAPAQASRMPAYSVPDAHPTQQLPALPPGVPPAPYAGSPAWVLADRLLRGQPAGVQRLTRGAGKVLTEAEYLAGRARLAANGVLAGGVGEGARLAAPFARFAGPDPAGWVAGHAAIAAALGAPPPPDEHPAPDRAL